MVLEDGIPAVMGTGNGMEHIKSGGGQPGSDAWLHLAGLGWVALVAALLRLPAKLPLGLKASSNVLWTGLATGAWPVALGMVLLRNGRGG